MSTATPARPSFKVADLDLAEFGRKEIRLAEHEMPGLMALRERYGDEQAAGRREDHGQPAHDGADRRADRDAGGARRRRALGRAATSSRPRTTRRRPSVVGPDGTPDDPQGVPVFAWKGETLEEYWWCTVEALRVARRLGPRPDRRRRRRRHAAGPQGRRVREGRQGAGLRPGERARGVGRDPRDAAQASSCATRSAGPTIAGEDPRRLRGDDDRRAPPLPDAGGRHAALPRDQRQRLGHQEQVRQHLRLPPLAARRPDARHRRHARRQGRRRLRLRRGRQGLRPGAARPGLPRDRHRDRPDLRAAGRHGGLRGQDARGRRRDRRHLRHGHGQLRHHHRRAHERG